MEEYLKNKLFNIIYDELNLKDVEDFLINSGVKSKKLSVVDLGISKYFTLLNDVDLNGFLDSELNEIKICYENSKLGNDGDTQKLKQILKNKILEILIPKTSEQYLFWGPMNFQYMAPAKSIVLAFNYLAFDYEIQDEFEIYNLCVEKMNDIQNKNISTFGVPIAIIMYDETFDLSNSSIRL